jgi:hypothetical protein
MEHYHKFFFVIKFILVFLLLLIYLDKIPKNADLYVIFDTIFKATLSIFILYFTLKKNTCHIGKEDKILLIITGVLLFLSINFTDLFNSIRDLIKKKNKFMHKQDL